MTMCQQSELFLAFADASSSFHLFKESTIFRVPPVNIKRHDRPHHSSDVFLATRFKTASLATNQRSPATHN